MTDEAPGPEQAIGIDEIAFMLDVSKDTVYRLVSAGDLPAFRVGRVWRAWPSEIRAALAAPRDPWTRSPAATAKTRAARARRRSGSAP